MAGELSDKRVLVVGASSGIGRAVALGAAAEGARVVAAARRQDRLAEIADDLPGGAIVTADVTREEDCRRLVADTIAHLGGLDGVVYAVGVAELVPMGAASADDWQRVLAANVVGAAIVTSAAAPALLESKGRAVLLSSRAVRHPFPRLALYSTSKFALDGLVRCLPVEFPGLRVTRVVVGDTTGTEFASGWDAGQLDAAVTEWTERGLMDGPGTILEPEQVAATILSVLPGESGVDDVAVVGG